MPLSAAHLEITDVLEVYQCLFLGVYRYAWKVSKILGRLMKQKDWIIMNQDKCLQHHIKDIYIYIHSFVRKAVISVISQLHNVNRNGIS